jgi:hypothetical protein
VTTTGADDGNSLLGNLVLLAVHHAFLWMIAIVATLVWMVTFSWMLRHGATLGRFLRWIDLNYIAFLERVVLRPFFAAPIPWVPINRISSVRHRILLEDAV